MHRCSQWAGGPSPPSCGKLTRCFSAVAALLQHIVQVRSNFCPICQQASECPMQRTMLAAVQATAERLIEPRYLMGQMLERTWTIC